MSDRHVRGGEVRIAVEASAQRASEIGYDESIAELGFDPVDLRIVCAEQGAQFLSTIPLVNASFEDVLRSLSAAVTLGTIVGIRLGKMYGETP